MWIFLTKWIGVNNVKELSKEDLEFLKQLGSKRKAQEKDGCADPVFWMIQDQKNVYCEDGEYYEFYDDGEMYYSTYHQNTKDDLEQFKNWIIDSRVLTRDERESLILVKDDDELVEWFEENYIELSCARFTRDYFLSYTSGPFLTKDAALKHLEENSHHYSKNARTYGMVGWRNPEFEHLMQIIESLGD